MSEKEPDKITQTAEGIPVGTSPEEERLRQLRKEGRLPDAAEPRGIPGEGKDA